MKILLIYPPIESFFIDSSQCPFGLSPPLGLLYIAKAIMENNDEVEVLDFTAEAFNEKRIIESIQHVDLIGITVLTYSLQKTRELIKLIKDMNSNLRVVIGGPHCRLFPKKSLMETGADISVHGEGEYTIIQIINAIENNKDINSIPGICYKENDLIRKNDTSDHPINLDSLSFPARNLIRHYTYGKHMNPSVKEGEFTSIITSRGCPYSCRFCSRKSLIKSVRKRSTEDIIQELKEIKKQGFKYVAFSDDSFPSNSQRDNMIFDEIIKEKLDLKFYVNAVRVDAVNKKLLQKMKQAGVIFVQYGLESGNQDVLDFYNKHITIEDIKKAVTLSHKMGFITVGTFILGAPFETKDHFRKTISFAKSLPLDSVTFLPLRYLAGSNLWSKAVENGTISSEEYIVEADSNKGLSLFSKKEIINYCKIAQQSYYCRPIFILRLIVSSLKRDDFTFIQSYVALFINSLRHKIRTFVSPNKNK
jgi:radical SAM superfamily enzyme YgiQ (UPF0313 family)